MGIRTFVVPRPKCEGSGRDGEADVDDRCKSQRPSNIKHQLMVRWMSSCASHRSAVVLGCGASSMGESVEVNSGERGGR